MRRTRQWIRLLAALAAVLALPFGAFAADRLLFDDFGGPPVYTGLSTTEDVAMTDLEWLAIPIYREIEGIPEDFNLINLLDNATPERIALARSVPLLIQGFVVREGSEIIEVYFENRPDQPTPFLFVTWEEFQEEVADDGAIYIDELLAMDTLQVAEADLYTETQRPASHVMEASGKVTSGALAGSSFHVHYSHGAQGEFVEAHITFR